MIITSLKRDRRLTHSNFWGNSTLALDLAFTVKLSESPIIAGKIASAWGGAAFHKDCRLERLARTHLVSLQRTCSCEAPSKLVSTGVSGTGLRYDRETSLTVTGWHELGHARRWELFAFTAEDKVIQHLRLLSQAAFGNSSPSMRRLVRMYTSFLPCRFASEPACTIMY
jgi:hypothetical protein